MRKIKLFRFDYEFKGGTWIVNIAAFNKDDALNLLRNSFNGPIKIYGSAEERGIDIIHDDVINEILEETKPEKKGRGRPKGSVVTKSSDVEKPTTSRIPSISIKKNEE
jgi:hypothetical protein